MQNVSHFAHSGLKFATSSFRTTNSGQILFFVSGSGSRKVILAVNEVQILFYTCTLQLFVHVLGWASLQETKEAEFVHVVGSCKAADSFGGVLECDLRIGSLITEQFDF